MLAERVDLGGTGHDNGCDVTLHGKRHMVGLWVGTRSAQGGCWVEVAGKAVGVGRREKALQQVSVQRHNSDAALVVPHRRWTAVGPGPMALAADGRLCRWSRAGPHGFMQSEAGAAHAASCHVLPAVRLSLA